VVGEADILITTFEAGKAGFYPPFYPAKEAPKLYLRASKHPVKPENKLV
jgi:hypothetical protein